MRRHAVRRLPVVEAGTPVGVVSIGDLVLRPDALAASELRAALVDIMAAPPDDPSTETHPNVTAALSADWAVPRMPPAADPDKDGRRRSPESFHKP
jgi:CBS domain-containing protein